MSRSGSFSARHICGALAPASRSKAFVGSFFHIKASGKGIAIGLLVLGYCWLDADGPSANMETLRYISPSKSNEPKQSVPDNLLIRSVQRKRARKRNNKNAHLQHALI
ncbi:uncharacterized protein ATNIH1004_011320 [Aspergillus tanneri]|uniref:Uncharacterized protein n=1 Tax=Aspergillus tanneri TaxID=1220188 RepID=A0A5M9M9R6_9EURO|nr:uncharacterized protein ATNIH1004_011320 [Aspergillus tanneri]KAA8642376.1 hypothetical protein ATNIH1004_011320 [Aspergillus tanneri]